MSGRWPPSGLQNRIAVIVDQHIPVTRAVRGARLFVNGPGPVTRLEPGSEGWRHTPEKSGMAAVVCPRTGDAKTAPNVANRRISRRCMFMSPQWSTARHPREALHYIYPKSRNGARSRAAEIRPPVLRQRWAVMAFESQRAVRGRGLAARYALTMHWRAMRSP